MYPSVEDCSPFNPEVIEQGINHPCYNRLMDDAKTYSSVDFADFCRRVISATDDQFYLSVDSWDELEEEWDLYIDEQEYD